MPTDYGAYRPPYASPSPIGSAPPGTMGGGIGVPPSFGAQPAAPGYGGSIGPPAGGYTPPWQSPALPRTAETPPPVGTTGPAVAGVPDRSAVQGFISQWQQSHNPAEGVGGLADALKANYGVDRYMYGNTPSGNEVNLGGERYKLLGGEGTSAAYWYQPGMNDSAPAAPGMPQQGGYGYQPPYAAGTYGALDPMADPALSGSSYAGQPPTPGQSPTLADLLRQRGAQ